MKTPLSFLDRVNWRLRAVGAELKLMWIVIVKYERAKTQEDLLTCFWYDFSHFKRIRPNHTIEYFLDLRVEDLKRVVANLDNSARKRQLNGDLLQALCDKKTRWIIVDYLGGKSPKCYHEAEEAVRSLWRMEEPRKDGEQHLTKGPDNGSGDGVAPDGMPGERDSYPLAEEDGRAVGVSDQVVKEQGMGDGGNDSVREEKVKPLNAKTYVIAVHLRLELEGREAEFESLSRRLPKLMSFIRVQFNVDKLPGRLEEFKGYSYKPILDQKTSAKKGQLRTPFRQIMEHPEIFGQKVADRAREILKKKFD